MTIDPYDREQVVKLLRTSADYIAGGQTSEALHNNLQQLANHLEQES